MAALAAGFGAALAGGVDEANAQASEIMLPHPDGEIVVNVARVALDTQMQILEQLQTCLQEGFEFSDADGNRQIEGEEQFDWDDERGFCVETAQSNFQQAGLRDRIEVAEEAIEMANADQATLRDEQAALQARRDAADADIRAITNGLIAGAQQEGS